jgi:DNA polymerase elongation subunit (family B)
MSAQLSVIWIQQEINKFLNTFLGTKNQDYVVASDTDSIYVTFEAVVNRAYTPTKQAQMGPAEIIKSLDKICQTVIGPEIDKYCQQLADYVNAYDQKLIMKREALANKAIWTAMKHYMINVFNNEGIQYAKPKLKIVGMEAIKSTTPAICRDKLKKAFEIIINEDEKVLRKFIDDFRVEFNAAPVQDIASPSGMNGLNDYAHGEAIFKSKTPFHTKGALVYNWWLNKLNLTKKYPLLKDGEKIKYVYLKEPNTIQSKVISFPNVLPAELGLAKYVDYDKMFHKNFLGQVEPIAEVIGWSLEETSSLEALFG